jgi:hypothetical protein
MRMYYSDWHDSYKIDYFHDVVEDTESTSVPYRGDPLCGKQKVDHIDQVYSSGF